MAPDAAAAAAATTTATADTTTAAATTTTEAVTGLGDAAAKAAAAAAAATTTTTTTTAADTAGKLIMKERPAWLGESFYDPKTGEVKVEALAANANDLKAKLSSGMHKPPATADGYAIDFAKETDVDIKRAAAALIIPGEDGKPDPIMAAVQADAFKEGVSTHAFNTVVRSYLKHMAGTLPAPFDEKAEMQKLGQNGPALLKGLNDFAEQQVKMGKWDEGDLARWRNWNYDAGDATLLYKMLFDSGQVPEIKIAAMTQAASTPDATELDKELADIQARAAKGENVQALFDANLAKREKLYSKEPTRSWPPPAA